MSNLATIRKNKGITQEELGEKIGTSGMMIANYERNRRDINGANLKTLLRICATLECSLPEILTDQELINLLGKVNGRN